MPARFLFDTDVLIDYLRGDSQAIASLEPHAEAIAVSAVTIAELYSGVREGNERSELDLFVSALDVIPVDQEIAIQAGMFRLLYWKSHRLGLPDTLIAATASLRGVPLVTLNRKHHPLIDHVLMPYQKS